MTGERPRVLLLRALGLGDFLAGVPAYRAVRRAFPDHEVVLAAPAGFADLAALTGAIDRVLPTGALQPVEWPDAPPDVAIDLHGTGPASRELLAALRPRRLIAHDASPSRPREDGEHETVFWCRLLADHGIPGDPDDLALAVPAVPPPMVVIPPPTVIHIGAGSPSRCWPLPRFTQVAARLVRDGHRLALTGSQTEHSRVRSVARTLAHHGTTRVTVLAGRTSAVELAALVAAARLVISGDTGVAHLATAYRRPSVVLFGPTPPSEWGPPAHPRHVALWPTSPGYRGDPHGTHVDPALDALTVHHVMAAIDDLR